MEASSVSIIVGISNWRVQKFQHINMVVCPKFRFPQGDNVGEICENVQLLVWLIANNSLLSRVEKFNS